MCDISLHSGNKLSRPRICIEVLRKVVDLRNRRGLEKIRRKIPSVVWQNLFTSSKYITFFYVLFSFTFSSYDRTIGHSGGTKRQGTQAMVQNMRYLKIIPSANLILSASLKNDEIEPRGVRHSTVWDTAMENLKENWHRRRAKIKLTLHINQKHKIVNSPKFAQSGFQSRCFCKDGDES